MQPVKVVSRVEVLSSNPDQVMVTYTDGTGVTMLKTDWDRQNQ